MFPLLAKMFLCLALHTPAFAEEAEEAYPDPQPNSIEASARERYHKNFTKLEESTTRPAPTPAGMPGSLLNPASEPAPAAKAAPAGEPAKE